MNKKSLLENSLGKRIPYGLLLIASGALPVVAQAGDGWYIGAEGGVNFVDKQTFKIYYPDGGGLVDDGTTIGQVKLKTGWLGGLVTGYSFASGLRPELEIDYRENDLKSIHVEPTGILSGLLTPGGSDASGVHGDENAQTAMANLWFDLFKSSRFHPYIGGGVGAARVAMHSAGYDGQDFRNTSDVVFAYQGGAGLGFDLGDHWTLSLDYRHLETLRAKLNLLDDTPETRVKLRYSVDSALLSLRYSFGEAPAEPPPEPAPVEVVAPVEAPPPPPAPPAPPPCESPAAGQAFTLEGCKVGDKVVLRGVNFEFDKATLTPDAKALLDMVSDALQARTDISVELDGHTDSKGSDAYNQKLSERRCESVKQYLVGRGIDAGRLTTAGFGETQPIEDNATDEGREYNRRVELKVTASNGGVTTETAKPE
ncbi:MAG: outer membrane protein OmpA [Hydrocarboniphaga sp.]|uniref:OmpA family protein n=1 Tax=Hydrocarboniphaga sp. TaxID=2033016 RepID=UPI0026219312|nr:OmpA family protein [Hydrocarboniphaga sp.]MDB5968254.1 outer membrane protein OmpA [Hydrocarboniphaga sp.]